MSTGTGQRHVISHADSLFAGAAQYNAYNGGKRGIEWPHLVPIEFGAVDTLDADGICVAATATAATALSATGALVSGGVATFDIARVIRLTSTSNQSARTFTIAGTDKYGETLVENIVGPNNTTDDGQKAFKTVTSVTPDAAMTGNITVGSNDVWGLPFRMADVGKFFGMCLDGDAVTTTLAAALSATAVSTATTADVRGTVIPGTAANGTRIFTAMLIVDHTSKALAFGVAQYGG